MDSIREKISKQLINAGFANFEFVEIDEPSVQLDGNGKPFYEKERLLIIFNNRLKGCLLLDPKNKMVDFLKRSIETLESIPDDSEIYCWQIMTNGIKVYGRSTEKQILHVYPTGQENPF